MALEEKLDNEFGPLADTVPRFKPGTWQESAELSKERITNRELRNIWLWTANFGMYTVENNEEFLYFGGRQANPIFNNIAEAARQLREEQNYKPTSSEIQAVRDSVKTGHTIKVKLSDLILTVDNDEWAHFTIDTANWQNMNDAQKLFAEKIYGSMKERIDPKTKKKTSDFAEYMAELKEEGKKNVNVYTLNQSYVKSHAPKDGAIARACWLCGFDNSSNFFAGIQYVGGASLALRGVRRVVAEGDAQKILDAYSTILQDPQASASAMTPAIRDGVSDVLKLYEAKQKQ